MASANSSSVHRARPAGGLAQAVATSRASSLLVSFRSAPGRCSSLMLLAQCPLQITLHETPLGPVHGGASHRHSAGNFLVAAAGIGCQQDLGPLELVRGALTFAQQRGQFVPFSLAQLDPITYIHPGLLVGEPDESTNESEIRRRSPPRRTTLHRKARPVPSLHLRILANVPLLSGRNRHAAPLPGQPAGKPFDFRRCRSAVRDVRPSPRFGDKLPASFIITS